MRSSNRGNGFFYRVLCILCALVVCGGAAAVGVKDYALTGHFSNPAYGVMCSSGIFALALAIIQSILTVHEWMGGGDRRSAWDRFGDEQLISSGWRKGPRGWEKI